MPSYPARFYLGPDERVRWAGRMQASWAAEPILVALALGALLIGAALLAPLPARGLLLTLVAAVGALLLLATTLYAWRRIATTEYVITEEAAYARRGRILLHVNSAPLDRITDLHVHIGLVGRLLGFARLVVQTAGGGLVLSGIKDAYETRTLIQETRSRYIQRLLADPKAPAREAPSPRPPPTTHCICPRCSYALAVRPERPLTVECPQCNLQGTLFEEAVA